MGTAECLPTHLETWTPEFVERARTSRLSSLHGVRLFHDFPWNETADGFGPNKFPGFKALDRELKKLIREGARISLALTMKPNIDCNIYHQEDGSICFLYGVDFLRQHRYRRSTSLVSGIVQRNPKALSAFAVAAEAPDTLLSWMRSENWRQQVNDLPLDDAESFAPRVLALAKEALDRLPEYITIADEDFSLLSALFTALVAKANQQGAISSLVALLNLDEQTTIEWVRQNTRLVIRLMQSEVTDHDVISLGYRRAELKKFERLLVDGEFFQAEKTELRGRGDEAVWQLFFERNPWIFGASLRLILMTPFDELNLEAVTTGATVTDRGKRVDALMKTAGRIGSLCFVEIKTHRTPLLAEKQHRPECWAPSRELAEGVAQVQKTVQKALDRTLWVRKNNSGWPTDCAYLYQPKAYVVIGSLGEFTQGELVNEGKYSSFELFRRHLVNPEVVTFDELYERAVALLDHEASRQGTGSTC